MNPLLEALMGALLSGGQSTALEKGPNLAMPAGGRTQQSVGKADMGQFPLEKGPNLAGAYANDRPAFTTAPAQVPMAAMPPQRGSDPNPAIPLPAANPERMPLPEQNTFGAFGEYLDDMSTQGNVTGEGFPPTGAQGGFNDPFAQGVDPATVSLQQALAQQILTAPIPAPTRSPTPNELFQEKMRAMLMSGGQFGRMS